MLIATLLAAAIPLWDVAITSAQMATLCPQAGITIKRTVNVDGFYTNFDFGDAAYFERGFKYIEVVKPWHRVEIYTKVGSEVQKQVIGTEKAPYVPKSRYEFIYGAEDGAFEGRRDIGIKKSIARDRETTEELGYALRYFAYPGWVDRNTIALFGQIVWMCPTEPAQDVRFMRQVILPNK
jgi:hypothetical protein